MNRRLGCVMIAMASLCMWGCGGSSSSEETPGQNNSEDNGNTGNPDTPGNNNDGSDNDNDEDSNPSQTCDTGEKLCDGICMDILNSAQHCGDCTLQCKSDKICRSGLCVDNCDAGDVKCGETCTTLSSDINNCGACGTVCAKNMVCENSNCKCDADFVDEDGDSSNGCELSYYDSCVDGDSRSCYSSATATENVGECHRGVTRCVEDNGVWSWSTCEDEVGPKLVFECTDKDYNCNGIADGAEDRDGDGYSICDGDCCDSYEHCGATNPEIIHPGMMETAGDKFDNNCDGRVDETEADVIATLTPITYTFGQSDLNSTARALTRAMDIIDECPQTGKCNYGLVSASLTYSGSTQAMDPRQVNVMSGMADTEGVKRILTQKGESFALLSSGAALDVHDGQLSSKIIDGKFEDDFSHEAQVGPDQVINGETVRVSTYSKIPDVYKNAHDGKLQTHEKCPTGTQPPAIFDSVNLHLRLKAPANATGFSFDFRFFSREYPQYLCSKFNDFFLVLSSSAHTEMASYPDKNIAFDELKNPVSVNNGFFTSCDKPYCGSSECPAFMTCGEDEYCSGGANTCRDGALAVSAYYPYYYSSTLYPSGKGGGTAWLHTTAPVNNGEEFDLDFYIWDTGDSKFDSTVILDNFKWEVTEVKVGTDFADIN